MTFYQKSKNRRQRSCAVIPGAVKYDGHAIGIDKHPMDKDVNDPALVPRFNKIKRRKSQRGKFDVILGKPQGR